MKITILGGTGWLGAEISAEAVKRGHEVKVISRHPQDIKYTLTPAVTSLKADAAKYAQLLETVPKDTEVLVNSLIPDPFAHDSFPEWCKNVIRCAIDACKKAKMPRLIYICGGVSSWVRPEVYMLDDQKVPGHCQTHKANDAIIGSHEVALEYLRTIKDFDWCCQTTRHC